MWELLPDDVVKMIVVHLQGDDVLVARALSTTLTQLISNRQMSEAFAGWSETTLSPAASLRPRIWLNELFGRRDAAFKLSVEQYTDLYHAVYLMATTYRKGLV